MQLVTWCPKTCTDISCLCGLDTPILTTGACVALWLTNYRIRRGVLNSGISNHCGHGVGCPVRVVSWPIVTCYTQQCMSHVIQLICTRETAIISGLAYISDVQTNVSAQVCALTILLIVTLNDVIGGRLICELRTTVTRCSHLFGSRDTIRVKHLRDQGWYSRTHAPLSELITRSADLSEINCTISR